MSDRLAIPSELLQLCGKVRDQALSADDARRLDELLASSPQALDFYVLFMTTVSLLESRENASAVADVADADIAQPSTDLLFELLRSERNAEDPGALNVRELLAEERRMRLADHAETLITKRDLTAAAGYVFRGALHSKAARFAAAAAVVLLGGVLFIVFSGPGAQPTPPHPGGFAADPPAQDDRVVARVTDAVGARWRIDDKPAGLMTGSGLRPMERLTLTHGFAELTTNRGAKALLHAPCTIELTGSDNALRLHRGRLVARCDTPSSKGFTVYAPDMEVVDLGTAFGVEADEANGSTVLVMEGSVRAQPTAKSPRAFEPVVLVESDARRVAPETGGLAVIAVSEAPVFYREQPHPYVAAVLDAKPVAYWRFEDGADRTVVNEVDPGRDGLKLVGSATLTRSGVVGRAGLLTNRVEPYGYFEPGGPIDLLDGAETLTIECWYYADVRFNQKDGRTSAMLISLHDTGYVLPEPRSTSEEMIAIEITDDSWLFDDVRVPPIGWREHSLRVYPGLFVDGEQKRDIYTDHAHPVQKWQHVVLVKDEGVITLYLDGKPVEELPHTFPPISPLSVRLGHMFAFKTHIPRDPAKQADFAPPRPLLGRLDEVALYDKPLTAEQVARHYRLATGDGGSPGP